jgi:4-hydroxy-tetrahydrodipicolinate reductase
MKGVNDMRIAIVGATGWVGRELVKAVVAADDFELAAAVARSSAGVDAGTAAGIGDIGLPILATLNEALRLEPDIVIDYSSASAIREHADTTIAAGRHLVVGSSGLTFADFSALEQAAVAAGTGIIASGNFSITAALLKRFAIEAARHVADVEVIEYASPRKADPPTGTGRELAEALSAARQAPTTVPIDAMTGWVTARGASVEAEGEPVQLHSVYLPSYTLAVETIHGAPGERLTIRHEAGPDAKPYVAGTLLAARRVPQIRGLVRGLDNLI